MRTSQKTQHKTIPWNDIAERFIEQRAPESDLSCLEAMFQEFTTSESSYSQEVRSNAWLLYKDLRELLEIMKAQDKKGGSDE